MRIRFIIPIELLASNNLDCYRHCGCPARVCVCVSVRSFLPLLASISRNIGTYIRVHRDTENSLYRYYNRDFR